MYWPNFAVALLVLLCCCTSALASTFNFSDAYMISSKGNATCSGAFVFSSLSALHLVHGQPCNASCGTRSGDAFETKVECSNSAPNNGTPPVGFAQIGYYNSTTCEEDLVLQYTLFPVDVCVAGVLGGYPWQRARCLPAGGFVLESFLMAGCGDETPVTSAGADTTDCVQATLSHVRYSCSPFPNAPGSGEGAKSKSWLDKKYYGLAMMWILVIAVVLLCCCGCLVAFCCCGKVDEHGGSKPSRQNSVSDAVLITHDDFV